MNNRFKHFAIKLLKKNGTDGLHHLLLKKKKNVSDFQAYCSRFIFILDKFDSPQNTLKTEDCLKLVTFAHEGCNLSPRELMMLIQELGEN